MSIQIHEIARAAAIDACKAIANPNYRHNGSLQKYMKFLDIYRYNQTVGELTRQTYFDKFSKNSYFNSNLEVLDAQPSVIYLKSLIEADKNRDYPKTKNLRDYIFKTRRLSLREVDPCMGYSLLDRIKILFKWY